MKSPCCNSENLQIMKKGPHYELFCGECLKYIRFIKKNEALRLQHILNQKTEGKNEKN